MKIKGFKIKETNNGWHATFYNEQIVSEYVYPSDRYIFMLEEISKFLIGKKIKVQEN